MPKLWNDTIDAHRQAVRDATMDATAMLVARQGLSAVTMSAIAEETGIGRATLYKYFPDIDSILTAWHERQVLRHLEQLTKARDAAPDPLTALRAVLEAYVALTGHGHGHDGAIASMLHASTHAQHAHHRLQAFVSVLIARGAEAGQLRGDSPAGELAAYCLAALTAAGHLPGKAARDRLIGVILTGLRATA
jgi:AcrR family transcriptional regulator